VKRKEIPKYIIFLLSFAFLFYAEKQIGVRAFAAAFFMALIYCRQNILILAPLYVGAAMAVSPDVNMLIAALSPPVVMALAYFIHYKLKVKIKLVASAAYLFLSQIPAVLIYSEDVYSTVNAVIGVVGSEIFLYASVAVLYAVLVKKLKYKLRLEESVAAAGVIAVFGLGLFTINIFWYTPFYTLLALVTLITMYLDPRSALPAAAAMGIGAAVASGEPFPLALSVLYGLVAICFSKESQYFAGIALIAADAIFRAFFNAETTFFYFSLISPAAGVLLFLIVPNKFKRSLEAYAGLFREKSASRTLVNRDRKFIAEKLGTLSGVFYEIQDVLHVENRMKAESQDAEALTREAVQKVCGVCQSLPQCKEALGGTETDVAVSSLVHSALDNGKATILDTPPFLSSRCRKINGLITAINDNVDAYRKGESKRESLDEGRAMVGDQMGGVGSILKELKKEVEKSLSYDAAAEARLIEELQAQNIAASEAAIYGTDEKSPSLTLIVREGDFGNPLLSETVNRILGTRMEPIKTEKTIKGMLSVHYGKAPVFQVLYGERDLRKEGSEMSGDRHGAIKVSENKIMLILSDGMGTGRSAGLGSSYAMSLIESFYRAGFDYKTIASSVSKLLSLRGREEFSAVDVAVVDVAEGTVDFIKMGGRESFIVNKGAVEVLECGSLPLGIIEEPAPIVEKRRIGAGSFIVMVSDGVVDYLGRDQLIELLSENKSLNPDSVAENIISELKRLNNAGDDASVLVARVFTPAA
jgi:Serine phosphatase RsbU, regulator of sigma subunit